MKGTPPYDVYGVFTIKKRLVFGGECFRENQPRLWFWFRHHNLLTLQPQKKNKYRTLEREQIKVMDSSTVCDYRVKYMKISEKKNIKTQLEYYLRRNRHAEYENESGGACWSNSYQRHILIIEMSIKKTSGPIDLRNCIEI